MIDIADVKQINLKVVNDGMKPVWEAMHKEVEKLGDNNKEKKIYKAFDKRIHRQMGMGHLGINTGSRSLWAAFGRKKRLNEHTFMLDSHESRKSLFGKNPINIKRLEAKNKFSDSFIFEITLYARYGTHVIFIDILT